MRSNIVLIGMPGSGKSTIGKILAKNLGYQFLDGDIAIEEKENAPLQEVLETLGVAGFLEKEADVLCAIEAAYTVIAPGGSAALSARAMAHLKQLGTCIYLDVPLEELERRVQNQGSRGIAAGADETLESIYTYRKPFYERAADLTYHFSEGSLDEAAKEIEALYFRKD